MQQAATTSPDAMCSLADYYFDGIGVNKDAVKARELVRRSADQGSAIGAKLLSEVYLDGKFEGEFDRLLGVLWLTAAADRGNPAAIAELALLNVTGLGMKQNLNEGRELLQTAMALGVDGAVGKLVELLKNAGFNSDTARDAFNQISAERGKSHNAAVAAAILLLTGNVHDAHGLDPEELLRVPSDAGDPLAVLLLRMLRDRQSKY